MYNVIMMMSIVLNSVVISGTSQVKMYVNTYLSSFESRTSLKELTVWLVSHTFWSSLQQQTASVFNCYSHQKYINPTMNSH